MSTTETVEMEYTGPGTKPPNIKVGPQEVADLEKTGMWAKASSSKKASKAEEDVKNG